VDRLDLLAAGKCERTNSRKVSAGWVAQAASLFVSAACRDAFSTKKFAVRNVAGKLPATAD